jgi:TolB-like protein/Flp pilus assembly protein TadD
VTGRSSQPKCVTVTDGAPKGLPHFVFGAGESVVTAIPLESFGQSNRNAVLQALERILKSGPFAQSRRRQRFLEYIVTETLDGRGDRLKGYSIAREVFDRPEEFDPNLDSIVRMEAARLRDRLREYYERDGRNDPIRIELPKGTYTPQIEFRRPSASDHPSQPARSRSSTLALTASALTLLIALLAGFSAWWWWTRSVPLTEKASIAVLSFENIGNDPRWTRLADGITEDIITDLSHSKDLFVVARNSTAVYRGKPSDVRNIGRDLGVRYVLEGSIQTSGDQIIVTTQLIDAKSGGHVWSNRYVRPAKDLFQVQSDVTAKIAATLTGYQGAVAEAERSLIRRKPPKDLTAYELYLLGIEAKHGGPAGGATKEGLDEAERLFFKALAIDPQLARAHVGLAYIYEYRLEFSLGDPAENLAKQLEAARNAVQLDPNDGETQLVLGHAFAYQGMADQALEQFGKAEALAPNNADVLILIAWYLPQLGQSDRAVALADRALQLNPNYPNWYNQGLRFAYFFGGKFDKSLKYAKLVTDPFASDYAYFAAASAITGNMAAAKAAAADVVRVDPDWTVEKYLSDAGGYPEDAVVPFVEGARKAGVAACLPSEKLSSMPNLVRLKTCDEERARQAAG